MALRNREKLLTGIVLLLTVALLAYYVLPVLLRGNSAQRLQRDRLAADVHKKQARIDQSAKAIAQVAEWERRSLPTDRDLAQSLYQNWLTQLVDDLKFRRSRVEPGEGRTNRGIYTALPFTVRGQATLAELVRFLYAFYTAGHLHQVRHLTLKPLEDSKDIEVVISIEALMLPGADRHDKLTVEPGARLALKALGNYEKIVVGRSPFTPFHLVVKKLAGKSNFDPSKYAFLTGVTSRDGRPEAWFVARTTDHAFHLHEGDTLEIDPLKGKILRIGLREVEIEMEDGGRHVFLLGRSLQEPADEAKKNSTAEKDSSGEEKPGKLVKPSKTS